MCSTNTIFFFSLFGLAEKNKGNTVEESHPQAVGGGVVLSGLGGGGVGVRRECVDFWVL